MKSSGNTMLITGGTSGIGLGLARRFLANGNRVVVSGRRPERLKELAEQHSGLGTVFLEVTDPASIAAAFDEVTGRYPDLNVLVNNAGIMLPENLLDPAHLETAEATVTTNLLGPIRLLARFTPFLAGKPDAAVVNVTSGLAYAPLPATPTYSATKAAIRSFTESLRAQLRDTNVQVIDLVPPAVRTTLMDQTDSPHAMPLDDFLTEAMDLFTREPDADQILVERVERQRFAEANGNYDEVLAMLSGRY